MSDLAISPDPLVIRGGSLSILDDITRAYASGDAVLAEHLFAEALDADLPWNEVCAAAALGVSTRYGPVRDACHA
jgi:hypothetical protein